MTATLKSENPAHTAFARHAESATTSVEDAALKSRALSILQVHAENNNLYENYANEALALLDMLPKPTENRPSLIETRKFLWDRVFYAFRNTTEMQREEEFGTAIRKMPYYHSSAPAAREIQKEFEATVRKHFAEIEIIRLRRLWGNMTVNDNQIVIRKTFQTFGARLEAKELLIPFLWYTR